MNKICLAFLLVACTPQPKVISEDIEVIRDEQRKCIRNQPTVNSFHLEEVFDKQGNRIGFKVHCNRQG